MDNFKLFDAEFRFMDILWQQEPINSTELSRICHQQLGWKKPTTYTMIRKLVERGLVQNEQATVSALITRDQVQRYESGALLERAFDNSLPAFVAAFLHDRKLSAEEAQHLQQLIEEAQA